MTKLIIFPDSFDQMTRFGTKDTVALDHIVVEISFKVLSVAEFYFTFSMFTVHLELSLIADPFVLDLCEIIVVKLIIKILCTVVE